VKIEDAALQATLGRVGALASGLLDSGECRAPYFFLIDDLATVQLGETFLDLCLEFFEEWIAKRPVHVDIPSIAIGIRMTQLSSLF
jgi:hypothetical protein